jgi:hypothetical protein
MPEVPLVEYVVVALVEPESEETFRSRVVPVRQECGPATTATGSEAAAGVDRPTRVADLTLPQVRRSAEAALGTIRDRMMSPSLASQAATDES